MGDDYTTLITSPNEVEVGDTVKISPSNAMLRGMPGMRMDPKMGKVESKTDTAVVVDMGGMKMPIEVPASARGMFKWDVYKKKKVGGRRKSRKSRRQTRRK